MGLHSLVLNAFIVGAILTLGSYLRNRIEMRRRNPQGLPYPPGPRGLPIVGNVLDMPRKQAPLTYRKWNEQYGPMTYVVAVGQPTLVISSYDIAKELLDKRGSNYINRPRLVMAGELSGVGKAMGMTQYGSLWKKEKRYLSKALSGGPIVKRNYSGLMINRATILLKSILDRPQDFLWEVKKMTGHIVMEVGYGAVRDDEDGGHDYIDMQFELGQITARTIQGYWVDFFPWRKKLPGFSSIYTYGPPYIVKHIPTWFPGAQFKRDGLRWGKQYDTVRDYMFERIKKRVLSADQGESLPSSFVRNTLRDLYAKSPSDREELKEEEDAIKYSSFSFYRAGADTPESVIRSFLLAMSLYPEFQVRARAEIDRVIGPDRLPTIDDRGKEKMPYVEAVVLEALRWNPPASMGVPHVPLHDDTYGGYFIPKGTIVTTNVWSMSRDPAYYTNPSDFTPERFLIIEEKTSSVAFNRATLDPCEYNFGFGRRICPGLDMSVQELWIAMVFILWAFEIEKKGEGKWDTDEDRFTFAFTSNTKPFDCNLVPRSDKVKEIINDAYSAVESLERRK
ncbi:hypothetical protein FRC04_010805 [Tulasnella sp. 424]|nr:hypothetical protein FRC04_010805 [Tulasnella sp. 424]